MAKLPKEITDEIYQSGYEKGFSDGYDKANANFELEYYQGHTLGEAYSNGELDGAREFADKLIDKCKENYENKDLALECKKCMIWRREEILELLAEWQKGKDNE